MPVIFFCFDKILYFTKVFIHKVFQMVLIRYYTWLPVGNHIFFCG